METSDPRKQEILNAAPDEVDFGAIMELMTSKYTVDLVDRHVAAIRKLCKARKHSKTMGSKPRIPTRSAVMASYCSTWKLWWSCCLASRLIAHELAGCFRSQLRKRLRGSTYLWIALPMARTF